jgi:hypothetical protein
MIVDVEKCSDSNCCADDSVVELGEVFQGRQGHGAPHGHMMAVAHVVGGWSSVARCRLVCDVCSSIQEWNGDGTAWIWRVDAAVANSHLCHSRMLHAVASWCRRLLSTGVCAGCAAEVIVHRDGCAQGGVGCVREKLTLELLHSLAANKEPHADLRERDGLSRQHMASTGYGVRGLSSTLVS